MATVAEQEWAAEWAYLTTTTATIMATVAEQEWAAEWAYLTTTTATTCKMATIAEQEWAAEWAYTDTTSKDPLPPLPLTIQQSRIAIRGAFLDKLASIESAARILADSRLFDETVKKMESASDAEWWKSFVDDATKSSPIMLSEDDDVDNNDWNMPAIDEEGAEVSEDYEYSDDYEHSDDSEHEDVSKDHEYSDDYVVSEDYEYSEHNAAGADDDDGRPCKHRRLL
jgi:hypothetical protein